MQLRSWILLGISAALLLCLGLGYYFATLTPPTITQARVEQMLGEMNAAVSRKDVNTLMNYVSPESETRLAGLKPDQLRLMLARAFRSTGKLEPQTSNIQFQDNGNSATVEFDLVINSKESDMVSTPYSGHVTLRLQRVEIPRLLGVFHAQEWRIVSAEHTGRDLNSFGDY